MSTARLQLTLNFNRVLLQKETFLPNLGKWKINLNLLLTSLINLLSAVFFENNLYLCLRSARF